MGGSRLILEVRGEIPARVPSCIIVFHFAIRMISRRKSRGIKSRGLRQAPGAKFPRNPRTNQTIFSSEVLRHMTLPILTYTKRKPMLSNFHQRVKRWVALSGFRIEVSNKDVDRCTVRYGSSNHVVRTSPERLDVFGSLIDRQAALHSLHENHLPLDSFSQRPRRAGRGCLF